MNERPFSVVDLEVIREVVRLGVPLEVGAEGSSMGGCVPSGSRVRLAPADAVCLGDIVLFPAGDRLVAHRVIRFKDQSVQTMGDQCAAPDPPVARKCLLARVAAAQTGAALRSFDSPLERVLALARVAQAWLRLARRYRARE
jgi:hypothetical protein